MDYISVSVARRVKNVGHSYGGLIGEIHNDVAKQVTKPKDFCNTKVVSRFANGYV